MAAADPGERDHLGWRRISGVEEWIWYIVAGITYVAAGIWEKGLLNWLVGPIWLVTVVVLGPAAWDRLVGRRRSPEVDRP